ncbi:MAG: type II secretion system ATPase GspE [Gammaproteobacteria bacterium]|nr:type II secretion system ATPase GspE [Gammaproteobacteria bacterium]MDH5734766.1 type II secretion system ATPase GspE [Gammaproteobacteria bacterium]
MIKTSSDSTSTQTPLPKLPYAFAKRHGVLIGQVDNDKIQILYRNEIDPHALTEVRRIAGLPIQLNETTSDQFDALLAQTYEQDSDQAMAMMEDVSDELDLDQLAETIEPEDLLEAEDDAPIIKLINAVLSEAIKINASDVHIEAFENRMRIRFRVDGVLREILQPPRNIAPLVISRIKVMAKLDIAEKRLPQDGRISLKVAGRSVDVRVSTLPSGHGERIVLRLLDKKAGRLDLQHLGMADKARDTVDHLLHRPHGIILVTGPTGSGKTTTLYAGLTRLNEKSRNILTVEDPIEYYLDGIGQTQVNTKVEMTFARGLRAILRQDPDVVMIGEIRDLETASIAVQASLTGHLVLSTLHTNTAIGAVTRLRDMGVEPFLLASSLIGVIAQRLVRKLCPQCKQPHSATAIECDYLGLDHDHPPEIYTAKGCNECNQLGYIGRTGIYELVPVDDKLQQMIHDGSGEQAMEKYARTFSASLRQDGQRLVLEGITSLEEILRVSRED